MPSNQSEFDRYQDAFALSLHKHWLAFLLEGIVLVILGIVAVLAPPLATLTVAILLGWLFLISGLVGLVTTLWLRQAPGFPWALLSALLGIVAGIVLIGWPLNAAISLTLVLVLFFLIEGVASIMFALAHRNALSGRWGWMLVSGIVDLFLGALILLQLPSSAAWAIGLLVGINMVFGGVSLIAMALQARTAD